MRNGTWGIAVLCCAVLIGCEPPDTAQRVEAELEAQLFAQEMYAAPELAAQAISESPIDELNASLENLRAKVTAEAPPAEESTDTPQSEDSRYDELKRELDELRVEVKRLQDTVDLTVSYVVGDLQEENRRLREEIARAYTAQPSGVEQAPPPDPGAQDAQLSLQAVEALAAMAGEQVNYGGKEYLTVKEWGRSPEEVKDLPDGVPSLRGLICAVAPGLNDAALSDLGRRIRAECDVYDNVMIEVFDNEAAARAYADQNIRSTTHNVLSIQKDGATGQDAILLHRHGVSIQVPR
ncbi:MAG: hypothetical protein IT364_08350 [Candidatus Hydrogenedentes bacterium]|nr:hypothetical protein [Candidatus Hydrogenedentota bacterium]